MTVCGREDNKVTTSLNVINVAGSKGGHGVAGSSRTSRTESKGWLSVKHQQDAEELIE